MLITVALALLVAWFLGVLGMYEAGVLIHVLLLVGLLLLMVGTLKARDAVVLHGKKPGAGQHGA